MTFMTYYILGIIVMTWTFVIDHFALTRIDDAAKDMDISILKTYLIIGIAILVTALLWPLFIVYEIGCIVFRYIIKTN